MAVMQSVNASLLLNPEVVSEKKIARNENKEKSSHTHLRRVNSDSYCIYSK